LKTWISCRFFIDFAFPVWYAVCTGGGDMALTKDDLQMITEIVKPLMTEIQDVKKKIEDTQEKAGEVQAQIGGVQKDVEEVRAQAEGVQKQVSGLWSDVKALQGRMQKIMEIWPIS